MREQTQQQRAESEEMAQQLEEWRSRREGSQWQQDRARLPGLTIRQDLLAQLAEHDVVVVSGDTGCGKTTQVLYSPSLLPLAGADIEKAHQHKPVWQSLGCDTSPCCGMVVLDAGLS